ncbi:Vacuolar calcium ion transporter 5 [Pleurostoma richardsiae]|uniref:Vacuolar calcium ion transporter 5 n=1 Tax=Pleurostoma richardsiae TaxID=41990 RepID=A0AA38RVF3_9PEZI|nr:Vacuolar calcium ion transporter 5 [Pleurostoma richardsiae]
MLLCSWLNVLLFFVPIGIVTFVLDLNPAIIFACNALAIVPLSALLTDATERIASEVGNTIGALLTISLGNIVELILLVALLDNHVLVVQASILGSIIVNAMLILGSALLACSLCHHHEIHSTAETQLLSSLLFVSVFVFLMPTAFNYTFNNAAGGADKATLQMSRISALVVSLVYVLYLVHELRASPPASGAVSADEVDGESRDWTGLEPHQLTRSPMSATSMLAPRTIRFADEGRSDSFSEGLPYEASSRIELGDIASIASESTEDDKEPRGRREPRAGSPARGLPSAYEPFRSQGRSRSFSLGSSRAHLSRESSASRGERRSLTRSGLTALHMLRDSRTSLESIQRGGQVPESATAGGRLLPVLVLVVVSALMSVCAEFVVGTIDKVTRQGHLSQTVIGLIILPIVGNVSEYVTVVAVAAKGNLDLAIAVAVGSSIQIALCVAPLTILAGWILGRDLSLNFNFFEMATLLGSVLLVNLLVLSDGSSTLRITGLKGGLMCACYGIISIGAYLSPT